MKIFLAIAGYLILGGLFAYLAALYCKNHDKQPLDPYDDDDTRIIYLITFGYPIVLILMGIQGFAKSIIALANRGKNHDT